jgi:hypothetical protein
VPADGAAEAAAGGQPGTTGGMQLVLLGTGEVCVVADASEATCMALGLALGLAAEQCRRNTSGAPLIPLFLQPWMESALHGLGQSFPGRAAGLTTFSGGPLLSAPRRQAPGFLFPTLSMLPSGQAGCWSAACVCCVGIPMHPGFTSLPAALAQLLTLLLTEGSLASCNLQRRWRTGSWRPRTMSSCPRGLSPADWSHRQASS